MNLKKLSFLLIICITTLSFAQTDSGNKVNIRITKANDDVYMLQGKGGNIGLSFGKESILMIDNQYAEFSEDILKAIRKVSDKPIKMLLNTHFHGDHTGGNSAFKKEGAIIFSHQNTRDRIASIVNSDQKKIDKSALPTVTFTDKLQLNHNNETIQAFHIAEAHTDGDIALYFPNSNVIHTGDVFFNGKYPFIDIENGGSVSGYIKGLEKIAMVCNEDTKIIPGHGDLASLKELNYTKNMLQNIYKQVTYHYVKEKSLEEVLAMSDITAEYDENDYGKGYVSTEMFIKTLYNDVKASRGPIDKRSMEERLQDKLKEQKEKMKKKE